MSNLKKITLICIVASLLVAFSTQATQAVVVTFPDANLEAAVRIKLNKLTGDITDADMESMTNSFVALYSSISSIQGMEYATNLTSLYLDSNDIVDISPVSGLTNLTWLYLPDNNIVDISSVSGLTNLTDLRLDANEIVDISSVSGLTGLYGLDLPYNEIVDISSVSGLTNLYVLNLNSNEIVDIASVSGLTGLTSLYLGTNAIVDISSVSGLTNLTKLVLSHNQIESMDLSGLNFSSLQYFDIADNPVTEVLLVDATLSQLTFSALMDGGTSHRIGIADLHGVLKLDMSGVDFDDILDFSAMYTMDDIETLLLVDATNLDGDEVVTWTDELDSLNWLNVTGLWGSFDPAEQNSLLTWDAIDGNTLVTVPEPATLSMLLILAALAILQRKRK